MYNYNNTSVPIGDNCILFCVIKISLAKDQTALIKFFEISCLIDTKAMDITFDSELHLLWQNRF